MCVCEKYQWNIRKRNKENNPIYNSIKTNKNFGVNLSKEVKDLYTENNKNVMKEVKEQINGKIYPCSWVWRINIAKLSLLPKVICRYNAIPIKIPMVIFNIGVDCTNSVQSLLLLYDLNWKPEMVTKISLLWLSLQSHNFSALCSLRNFCRALQPPSGFSLLGFLESYLVNIQFRK